MKLIFSEHAWEDYLYWQKTDKKIISRINKLIKEVMREPFAGVGKPEPLKHNLAGYWSRRINEEHRMVYKITDDALLIAQLRYHY
ncbi:Txe/YoeB family addiction module toxin [Alkalimonas delamerensis]|uniref:Putative mRNA interferase YoeB n=1 Tax=Alkalimonas delamerensis TaxID=265981 RepID=A0ABT9GSE2_9GAMM|nr:Txe/YoeB family addiction module toxin [Alkalimonas delamerensis]MDP4529893.1 Txe/YoeB family addiction module toxin [Alkalimonas delamerensis]